MLDAAGVPDVETVLNIMSILDETAAPDTPLPLLEAGRDEVTTPSVLSPKSEVPPTTMLEVRIVLILILDPDPNRDAPALPIPRPLYR